MNIEKQARINILKRFESFYNKNKDQKRIIQTKNKNEHSYLYKRLKVEQIGLNIEIYDTSTDIYRPLSLREVYKLDKTKSIDDFCNKLFIKNSKKRIRHNRKCMQIAIAKNNDKEKMYHYKIATQEIKILRLFLDININ